MKISTSWSMVPDTNQAVKSAYEEILSDLGGAQIQQYIVISSLNCLVSIRCNTPTCAYFRSHYHAPSSAR